MERCLHRAHKRRVLVVLLVLLVASRFAVQVRDDGLLAPEASQAFAAGHFVANAFPTAEASVVGGR